MRCANYEASARRYHRELFRPKKKIVEGTVRVLILNPNTTREVTGILLSAAQTVARAGLELIPMTATRGVPYIATRAEAQIGGAVALEMLAECHDSIDAAVIAAFGDPGIFGARELFDIPIVGMAESAMLAACALGKTFTLVTFTRALAPWYRECVEMHGLIGRCASIRALDERIASIAEVQNEKETLLVDLANSAVSEDEADVIILAGAPLAGLSEKVRDRVPVPIVDPISAAVCLAETIVRLNPKKPEAGTFRRPEAKTTKGLSNALADRIEHRT
jgi:Asp/Glu/hydantoin racemase